MNRGIARELLEGTAGPRRDITLVNAAAGLVAAERASGWVEGMRLASESLDSGAARRKLEALAAFSR